jgi:hypothetical protein
MLNTTIAAELRERIDDSRTFPPPYYTSMWARGKKEKKQTIGFLTIEEAPDCLTVASWHNTSVRFVFEYKSIIREWEKKRKKDSYSKKKNITNKNVK